MYKSNINRQKIRKYMEHLNNTNYQFDPIYIYIYRTFHPKTAKYTLFQLHVKVFIKKNDMVGHKISAIQFKVQKS